MPQECQTAAVESLHPEHDSADVKIVEARARIADTIARGTPHFLRHPTLRLAFQSWPKDSWRFRAACKAPSNSGPQPGV